MSQGNEHKLWRIFSCSMASANKGESHRDVENCSLRNMAANVCEASLWVQCATTERGQRNTRDEKNYEASGAYLKPLLVDEPEPFDEVGTFLSLYPERGGNFRCRVVILI